MKFGAVPIDEAHGCVLGHTHRLGTMILRKGTMLNAEHLALFRAHSYMEVTVARLAQSDILENQAAAEIAAGLIDAQLMRTHAIAGRCNIRACVDGLLCYDIQQLDELNSMDWRVTVAAKSPFAVVHTDQVVVTVKIIPYSIPQALMEQVIEKARNCFRIRAFIPHEVALILSKNPSSNPRAMLRAIAAQEARVQALGSSLGRVAYCAHTTESVVEKLKEVYKEGWDLILFLGASAVVDEYDIFPRAIRESGGEVLHIGMPVDPGNMLVLARIEETSVIGIPGCARSTKKSGFDWVLQRLLCKSSMTRQEIMRMGAGGLRSTPTRISSRTKHTKIGAVILMAGTSSRMGQSNKLLAKIDGVPIGRHVVHKVQESGIYPIVVVTGHESEKIREMLDGLDVYFIHNDQYDEGMGSSIRKAFSSIHGWDAGMIMMGDMPFVRVRMLMSIKEAYLNHGHPLVVPLNNGNKGHPVLFSSSYFTELQSCGGDTGARGILKKNHDDIYFLKVDEESILWDVDTPEDLLNHQKRNKDE